LLTVTIHYKRTLLDAMATGFIGRTRGYILSNRAATSVINRERYLKEVITSLMPDKKLDVWTQKNGHSVPALSQRKIVQLNPCFVN
jgi:hypothetical protein